MSLEKPKPYTRVVIISIVLITLFSFGILIIMSSWLQGESTRLMETSEALDNFGNLADADIQVILQEDSAKYETAYSNLNELYALNDKYQAMIDYNQTHPQNYTQQNFDEVKIDFTVKMRSVNFIVQSTSVYEYSVNKLGASVLNNYSNFGFDFYFINNQLVRFAGMYEEIHVDILDYVNASFVTSGDSFELPKIHFEKWTYHLYNNLSILESIGPRKASDYIIHKHTDNFELTLVNLSLAQLATYHDKYVLLLDKVDAIYQDLNNTLITLALAGVLMGFATSFENINYRRISMVVGLVILFLSIFYFTSAFSTLLTLAAKEAGIIGVQGFVFV
ncbi:MAG: hypothetical protein E3J70_01265 [Candidatus Heimdallarchaeota archaeon]|nr:MAG: hypothetical protein E3J70_01265 [Candidatus Heimdallarchaeota archaeon]